MLVFEVSGVPRCWQKYSEVLVVERIWSYDRGVDWTMKRPRRRLYQEGSPVAICISSAKMWGQGVKCSDFR